MAPDRCVCEDGYIGPSCNDTKLCPLLNNCNGNGVCVSPNACLCDLNYIGSDCATANCSRRNDCSGNGRCVEPDLCLCATGWLGANCSSLCGNGVLEVAEECDDANRVSNDGCSDLCRIEKKFGWNCFSTVVIVETKIFDVMSLFLQQDGEFSLCAKCGNGVTEPGEQCDVVHQGCSLDCTVEPGFQCGPETCTRLPVCGNKCAFFTIFFLPYDSPSI